MKQRVRVLVSSPGDVKAAREVAALTNERLGQDYARFFTIEPHLWEYEEALQGSLQRGAPDLLAYRKRGPLPSI